MTLGRPRSPPQYGEFRQGFNKDKVDTRMVNYGIRYLVENYISKPWTREDVAMAEAFYRRVQCSAVQWPLAWRPWHGLHGPWYAC